MFALSPHTHGAGEWDEFVASRSEYAAVGDELCTRFEQLIATVTVRTFLLSHKTNVAGESDERHRANGKERKIFRQRSSRLLLRAACAWKRCAL